MYLALCLKPPVKTAVSCYFVGRPVKVRKETKSETSLRGRSQQLSEDVLCDITIQIDLLKQQAASGVFWSVDFDGSQRTLQC